MYSMYRIEFTIQVNQIRQHWETKQEMNVDAAGQPVSESEWCQIMGKCGINIGQKVLTNRYSNIGKKPEF